jgi:hypothetical protein
MTTLFLIFFSLRRNATILIYRKLVLATLSGILNYYFFHDNVKEKMEYLLLVFYFFPLSLKTTQQ